MTELDVNGILVSDTADSIVVNENSITQVDINNVVVWTRAVDLPDKPESFTASNNLRTYINCEWTTMGNTTSVNLYDDILGAVATNIESPYAWYGAIPGTLYNLRVVAINEGGATASDPDTGIAPIESSVTIGPNGFTFTGAGDAATISMSNGVETFIAPAGIEAVECYCLGAGGSGAFAIDGEYFAAGAGFAGTVVCATLDTSGTINIQAGTGGIAVTGVDSPWFTDSNGNPGIGNTVVSPGEGHTGFATMTSTPGAGGEQTDYHTHMPFYGNGETVSNCSGENVNGIAISAETSFSMWTASGGQSCGYSKGGNAEDAGDYAGDAEAGGPGSGGGARIWQVNWSSGDMEGIYSGRGGDGAVVMSW